MLTYLVGGLVFIFGSRTVGLAIIGGAMATDLAVSEISKSTTGGDLYEVTSKENTAYKTSIAHMLKNTVATYYKVFQYIALVLLLSILVYVAIRIMISSTSKDKAKYKKMLWDWIVAICIVYLLHFLMSITLTIVSAINDVFANSVIQGGRDILMSGIRTKIGFDPNNMDLSNAFFNIIIYLVLVIYTIQFTIIYLKRVIHMAFLTIISPMVAFTYTLDKIKDGKAQALGLWIKEFMFNALMQPIHMILYYIFVGGAAEFATKNPIYALVMIGFLIPGEKFVRKMFGLESDESMGSMTAAMGGAAIMNAMNKMKSAAGKAKGMANKGKESGGKIRTANEGAGDPYDALRTKDGNGTNAVSVKGTGANQGTGKGIGATTQKISKPSKIRQVANNIQSTKVVKGAKKGLHKLKNTKFIKGATSVAKKYVLNKKTGKKLLRGTAKIAGGAMLGSVGLAAGIATGDMSNAVAGLTGGVMAGSRLGDKAINGAENVAEGARNVRDTYREGKYGKEEYERMKFDKEFKKSAEYKKLVDKYPGQEKNIQEFLNAGFTDTKQMTKAMENIKEGNYNPQEAMAYMKMANAKDCPDEILNDKEKFKEYLQIREIPIENADKIRKAIIDFK